MKRLIALLSVVLILLTALLAGVLYLDQRPHDVAGTVRDADGAKPIEGAHVQLNQRSAVTGPDGRFALPGVAKGSVFTVTASGYVSRTDVSVTGVLLEFSWPVEVALQPTVLEVTVVEAGGGPVVGAAVTVDAQSGRTGEGGRSSFKRVPAGATVFARADGYESANAAYREGSPLQIALQPNTLAGTALETGSDAPVPGAAVQAGTKSAASDAAGKYTLRGIPGSSTVTVAADGYLTAAYTFVETETKRLYLTPNTLTGRVLDGETGAAVPGVALFNGGRSVQADAQGRYSMTKVLRAAVISATADGFVAAQAPVQGRSILDITLQPNQITGQVTDIKTGQPVITATVYIDGRSVPVDSQGRYTIKRVKRGATVMATADNYGPAGAEIGDNPVIDLALRPGVLSGVVRDGATGKPVAGATVAVNGAYVTTDANGLYKLSGVEPGATITAKYPGYRLTKATIASPGFPTLTLTPFIAKGLYFPFGTVLGDGGSKARALIDAGRQYGINAIVVDVKGDIRDDVGRLIYKSASATAARIGSTRSNSNEILALLKYAKDRNFYTIARIMAFKDDLIAKGAPEMAIKRRSNGGLWMDTGGSYWADPYHPTTFAYALFIAKECAALGFDEVQFDYIRMPSDGSIGDVYYPSKPAGDTRTPYQVIEGLVSQIPAALPMVYTSLDTFGWTAWEQADYNMSMSIGQRLPQMAKYVDYMSPMIYPSTFSPGDLGYKLPAANPYDLVYRSSVSANKRVNGIPALIRPWIQDFDDYTGGIAYNAHEVAQQLNAAEAAGVAGWLIWNPAGIYTQGAWNR